MTHVSYSLGVDIGTTSIKIIVYNLTHKQVAHVVSSPTPVQHPRPDWAEWDPHVLWDTVARAVRDAVAYIDSPARVVGLGIASVGEAGVPLDARGHPLRSIIAWFDPRGEEYAEQWWHALDTRHLYLITGHFPRSLYTAFKLLWLREHEPEVFARLGRWLFVGDYIAYRMTGEMATVPTLAARSFLFDVVRREWSKVLLDEVGLRLEHMPPVQPTTEPVGYLRSEIAQALNLPAGIPVALGGHDHVVGMWVAGIALPHRAVDSSGTAQGIAIEVPQFIGERGYETQLSCYPMAVGDTYILQGGMPTAGAALQWLADIIADGSVETLLSWAQEAPVGSRGMGVIPFLRGPGPPYRHAAMRGVFYQVDLAVGRAEMARALVEGLACFTRDVVDLLERVSGISVREVRAIGGVNRNLWLLKVKASMLARPMVRVDIPEVVGTGAALLGGIVAEAISPADRVPAGFEAQGTRVAPVPEWVGGYRQVFTHYRGWVRAATSAVQ